MSDLRRPKPLLSQITTSNTNRSVDTNIITSLTAIMVVVVVVVVVVPLPLALVKLATLVEGDPKPLYSIATKPRCGVGRYFISWIAPLYP